MILLVCGGRDFVDYDLLKLALSHMPPIEQIISGGAAGADSLVERYAYDYKVELKVVKPDWSIGRHAGMVRNIKMLDMKPDIVIAFWDGKSKGTGHMIKEAHKRGIEVKVAEYVTS